MALSAALQHTFKGTDAVHNEVIFTRDQFWILGIVIACICPSVRQPLACPCDNLWPIQAKITKFGPEVQTTLVKIPTVLFCGMIDLDLQGQI